MEKVFGVSDLACEAVMNQVWSGGSRFWGGDLFFSAGSKMKECFVQIWNAQVCIDHK